MQDNVKHLSLIRGWLSNNNLEHYISTIEEEIAQIKGIDTSELTSLLNAGKKAQAIQLANELRQGALNERAASFASLEWLDKIIAWADELKLTEKEVPRDRLELLAKWAFWFGVGGDMNAVPSLPSEFANFKWLEGLSFDICGLRSCPEFIGEFENLKWLTMNSTYISELPQGFARLQRLEELFLCDGELTQFPLILTELKGLERLHLYENKISELPDEMSNMQGLQGLSLGDCKFTHFRKCCVN